MLDTLITSKTRIKLLLKFFLNSNATSYLRNLETEFGESSNAIRIELNKFEEAGLLKARLEGNKKIYQANTGHPLFGDIHSIIRKYMGFDKVIDKVISRLGMVEAVFVTGEIARGINSAELELVMIGDGIEEEYLGHLVDKAEKIINRRISCRIFSVEEGMVYVQKLKPSEVLLLWKQ